MTFLLVWLSSYRVTRFIVKDTIVNRQREWFYRRFPPNETWACWYKTRIAGWKNVWRMAEAPRRRPSKIGELFSCSWCLGFWVSGLVVLVVAHYVPMRLPFLWWLATSAAVGLTAMNLDG